MAVIYFYIVRNPNALTHCSGPDNGLKRYVICIVLNQIEDMSVL